MDAAVEEVVLKEVKQLLLNHIVMKEFSSLVVKRMLWLRKTWSLALKFMEKNEFQSK